MNKIHVQICFECSADLNKVKEQLTELKNTNQYIFHHCFLSRKHVEEKGFTTDIVDMLDEVLGADQEAHLNKYDTFADAMLHIDKERKEVANGVNRMFVLDSGTAEGIRKEIELFTNMKVILLP